MPLRRRARNAADFVSLIAGHAHVSIGKSRVTQPKWLAFCILAVLTLVIFPPCKADVPPPPSPPQAPAGYCSTIYGELSVDLQAFNRLLTIPPTWTPVSGGPTLYGANLHKADGNVGPQISGPNYLDGVVVQLQELKALGIQAVIVPVPFPVLYQPFFGSAAKLKPYLDFYSGVAQTVKAAGLKLIVDNEILFSSDVEAGWTNTGAFYSTLGWAQYMAARATMAATIASTMQPDYLLLAEEPDTEANQTGQANLNNPADAAQMIAGEIAAVQALNLPNIKLGAGVGSWVGGLTGYIGAYVLLPLDYIDFHLFPINTELQNSFIDNTLVIASMAAAAGKPVASSQAWLWKMEDGEWNVLSHNDYRARNPFSFWAPLDAYFLQTLQTLANYTQMLYAVPEGPDYLFAYQTYGGTAANGGDANCTCTTTSCSDYEIVQTENSLSSTANSLALYTTTGFSFYNQLVSTPDATPPAVPTHLTGQAGYTQANISWTGSTDNIGIAGYNVYRCSPPALGQPCAGVQIATTTVTAFSDSGLTTDNTPYNYQVEAFDLVNNHSPLSPVLSLQTLKTSAASPTNLAASVISPKEIDLSWSPPVNTTGLSKYVVYSGDSTSSLQAIATEPSTKTTYRHQPLAPATTYYYAVVAVESGINSAMSPFASATTLPLPDPPTNITATATSSTQIVLTWQETAVRGGLPVTSYQVFEGTTSGQLKKVATAKTATYTAKSLTPDTTYYFEIVAVDTAFDASVPSDQISAATPPLPPPPTNLQASTPVATQIVLTWQWAPLSGGLPIARYLIDCGISAVNPPQVGVSTSGPSFTYRNASPSTPYYCQVVAVDSANDSSQPSSQITVTTPPMPAAPANVVATADSSTKVTVTWSETIPPNGLPIRNYTIFRGTSPTALAQLITRPASPYVDTGVTAGTIYYYAVEATDTGGDVSPMSSPPAKVTTP